MGSGIWAMHFTAMLALQTSMAMHYQITLTLISVVVAIVASYAALYLVMRVMHLQLQHYLLGGLLVGLGIATMHYLGMEAMKIEMNYTVYSFYLCPIHLDCHWSLHGGAVVCHTK